MAIELVIQEFYKVGNYLLSDEWNKEKDYGRISFCFESCGFGFDISKHKEFVEREVKKLLSEHDEGYISWVKTDEITKEFSGYLKFATVVNFRVRDAG